MFSKWLEYCKSTFQKYLFASRTWDTSKWPSRYDLKLSICSFSTNSHFLKIFRKEFPKNAFWKGKIAPKGAKKVSNFVHVIFSNFWKYNLVELFLLIPNMVFIVRSEHLKWSKRPLEEIKLGNSRAGSNYARTLKLTEPKLSTIRSHLR